MQRSASLGCNFCLTRAGDSRPAHGGDPRSADPRARPCPTPQLLCGWARPRATLRGTRMSPMPALGCAVVSRGGLILALAIDVKGRARVSLPWLSYALI